MHLMEKNKAVAKGIRTTQMVQSREGGGGGGEDCRWRSSPELEVGTSSWLAPKSDLGGGKLASEDWLLTTPKRLLCKLRRGGAK